MDMNNFTWNEKEYGCPLIFLLLAAKDLVIDNDFDSCSFLFGDLTMLFDKTWIFYDNFRSYEVYSCYLDLSRKTRQKVKS